MKKLNDPPYFRYPYLYSAYQYELDGKDYAVLQLLSSILVNLIE
jgi:hypothetical protein